MTSFAKMNLLKKTFSNWCIVTNMAMLFFFELPQVVAQPQQLPGGSLKPDKVDKYM